MPDMNLESCIAHIMCRCWLIILLSLLVVLALTAGAQYIVNVDFRNHFDKDDPRLIALEQLEETYAISDTALVAVAPQSDTIFTREVLAAVEELTVQLWRTPYITRVDSLANYSHSEAFDDDLIVEPLIDDASSLDDNDIERIKFVALNTEEIAGRFTSRNGRVAGLILSFAIPEDRQQAKVEVIDFLSSTIAAARTKYSTIDYQITGELALNRAMKDAMDEEFGFLGPIALGTLLLVSILLLRSIWGTVSIILMIFVVLLSAVGFIGWSGLKFYGESAAALFVLMAVTVVHSVHVIEAMLSALRQGMDRKRAAIHSLRLNVWPVFLTSHYHNRILESEFLGYATVSDHGQHGGVRIVVRVRLFGHPLAHVSVVYAHACPARTRGKSRLF